MVEIIPKTKKFLNPGRQFGFVFYLIVFLLIVSIASYFILNFLLESSRKEFSELDADLKALMTPEKKELEREVLNINNKIRNFSLLSQSHIAPSQLFIFIEENTHPDVWFFDFDLALKEKKVILHGRTRNYENLGQQVILFENEPAIIEVDLQDAWINRRGGSVDFILSLEIKQDVFNPYFLRKDQFNESI